MLCLINILHLIFYDREKIGPDYFYKLGLEQLYKLPVLLSVLTILYYLGPK